jgi:uncharacterized protein YbbC (DUF1343 family)
MERTASTGSAVASGLDRLLAERGSALRGARVGLLAHPASVDRSLVSTLGRLRALGGVEIVALFGPEHGLQGEAQDMAPVAGGRDGGTGIRVHSLYGETEADLAPTEEMLEGIDLILADLQDVGARYYTFAATVALALEPIARRSGRLVVLDRPNPIGGLAVEGPRLAPGMESFVGAFDVPVRHGLTLGELLVRHARAKRLERSLEVVPMEGWRRSMDFEATGLPWIPPSPNVPTVDTAFVYPGTCLLEGTNLSEGRGTTRPFEWIGAPYLDGRRLAERLAAEDLPGTAFRPIVFRPSFHKWSGEPCGGVAIHVTDRRAFRPVKTGIAILVWARRLAPGDFAWRDKPYEYVSDRPAIDLLTGGKAVREGIESDAGVEEIVSGWDEIASVWTAERSAGLLYP